ncbi:MAG: family 16 glycosylhydrolase [Bacteroidia bacterium]|nr:family 16 glycosylhydrolase [Bacteroidia bacterium]NND11857.1 family 16 glycosylhydrolase [Flavobacteriaceae bacterium]NNK28236.1 family 16 glycosylhydrolase [Flavobacteriaceae bacterium]
MRYLIALLLLVTSWPQFMLAQSFEENFEGTPVISTWYGDNCAINASLSNPEQNGINLSNTVMSYHDTGGQYANARFDVTSNFDLMQYSAFSLKVFVPSSGITGSSPNQISLKLQDGNLAEPWITQSEIIKPITLDSWQEVTFDFATDSYINLDGGSPAPVQRTDFNRVVIQLNGENNNDHVFAYLDDIFYGELESNEPVFDNLVWSDEFDGSGAINTSKWFHQTQLPNGGSWYNGEIQHYTNRVDNSFLSNGNLSILAKKETFSDQGYSKDYTSARLNSKFAFTYGRIEIKAKLPTGVGTWPAIWMLGKNITEPGAYWYNEGYGTTGWPACGEIDIMEHWGNNQNYVQSAMHTPSSFGGTENKGGQVIPTASTEFHIYELIWTSEKMTFSVDGTVHYTYNPEVKDANTWPFDAEQYLLLNIAIEPTIDPGFTQSAMEIDYVRVYQESVLSNNSEIAQLEDKLYPNPVRDSLQLKVFNSDNRVVHYKILDINGRLISNKHQRLNDQQLTINVDFLKQGVYFLKLENDEDQISTHKFIKR